MMTAYIPKVDSCYAADLTRWYFFFSLPSSPPAIKSKEKATSLRKQSFPVINASATLQTRGRIAAAVCCTLLHGDCTQKKTHSHWQCGLFCLYIEALRVSACLVTPPPPPPPHSSQLAGHAHFHAHKRPSSNVQGAVIYGARSLSVYAGNSSTHGRTAGMEGKGTPGNSPFYIHFLSNPHTSFTKTNIFY